MTQDEIAKLIPDNVVEAAAKDDWNRCRKGALAWDCVSEMFKEGARIRARASLAAGLAAWGGMQRVDSDLTIGMAPFVALPIMEQKA